jgi:hypothetical protein
MKNIIDTSLIGLRTYIICRHVELARLSLNHYLMQKKLYTFCTLQEKLRKLNFDSAKANSA